MYRCVGPLGTLLLNDYMLICGEHEGNVVCIGAWVH